MSESEEGQVELAQFPKGTELSVGFNETRNCMALVFIYGMKALFWPIDSQEEAVQISNELLEFAAKLADREAALH